jgi:hypothetical protein
MIVAQQPAQALSAFDWPVGFAHLRFRSDQLIVEILMVAFRMMRCQAVVRLSFGWADSERGSYTSALEVSPRISEGDTSEPTLVFRLFRTCVPAVRLVFE